MKYDFGGIFQINIKLLVDDFLNVFLDLMLLIALNKQFFMIYVKFNVKKFGIFYLSLNIHISIKFTSFIGTLLYILGELK